MKRTLLLAASALLLLSSCSERPLPRDNWDKNVYEGLCTLIDSLGSGSATYDPECKPYAVFDFDNTTVMNDIEFNTIQYGIENLKFIVSPDSMKALIMDTFPDSTIVLEWKDGKKVPAADMADDIASDYRVLYDKYLAEGATATLDEVHALPEYLDFRAKLRSMYNGVLGVVDETATSQWLLYFVKGMTKDQLQAIIREGFESSLAKGNVTKETWESPDMGKAGKISVTFDTGMTQPKEMLDLYKGLRDHGFDVYICSASLEDIVEAIACNDKYGYNLDTAYVYGMREYTDSLGRYTGIFRKDYTPTIEEGKTTDIIRFMASAHNGNAPALVAGDSNGDYSMLSSFPTLGRGLIINRDMPEPLSTLYGKSGYLLQGRNPAKGKYIRSSESQPVK